MKFNGNFLKDTSLQVWKHMWNHTDKYTAAPCLRENCIKMRVLILIFSWSAMKREYIFLSLLMVMLRGCGNKSQQQQQITPPFFFTRYNFLTLRYFCDFYQRTDKAIKDKKALLYDCGTRIAYAKHQKINQILSLQKVLGQITGYGNSETNWLTCVLGDCCANPREEGPWLQFSTVSVSILLSLQGTSRLLPPGFGWPSAKCHLQIFPEWQPLQPSVVLVHLLILSLWEC